MSEVCIENPDYMEIEPISSEKYKHVINIQELLTPPSSGRSALLILNQRITMVKLFLKLWDLYDLRVCADGAANYLYRLCEENNLKHEDYLPHYIVGDLDSILPEVEEFYKRAGVYVIKQTTQYSTDFMKSINLITCHFYADNFVQGLESNRHKENFGISLEKGIHEIYDTISDKAELTRLNVLATGGIDGRFDQTINSIAQLYTLPKTDPYIKLSYLTATDLIFLIPAGGALIQFDRDFKQKCIGNCGLLPIGLSTVVKETIGLKWDIANWPTSVNSGRVSSNNRFVGDSTCYIDVDDCIVINVEIKKNPLAEYI